MVSEQKQKAGRKPLIAIVLAAFFGVLALILIGTWILGEDVPTSANSVSDPVVPGLGNEGYDVQSYDLDLSWDQDQRFLEGLATISAIATETTGEFSLDLSGLDVSKVDLDGVSTDFEHDDPELIVKPSSVLQQGEQFELVIAYEGTPGTTSDGIFDSGWHVLDNGSYVLGQPRGASLWFPVNDHPSDKATFSIEVTTDETDWVASNGVMSSRTPAEDGQTTWQFEMAQPMAPYLTTIVIGQYELENGPNVGDVEIRNIFPADSSDQERQPFDVQPEMLAVFNDLFGQYPFDNYGVAVVDDSIPGALETQTLSVFGRGVDSDFIISHELAHQWFGNSVTIEELEDIWISEGFATYASYLWEEFGRSRDIEQVISEDFELRSGFLRGQLDRPPARPVLTEEGIFEPTVYYRGALVVHALRLELGDSAFFELLQSFAADFEHQNITTEEFIELAEAKADADLSDLFDEWLFSEGLPESLAGIDLSNL